MAMATPCDHYGRRFPNASLPLNEPRWERRCYADILANGYLLASDQDCASTRRNDHQHFAVAGYCRSKTCRDCGFCLRSSVLNERPMPQRRSRPSCRAGRARPGRSGARTAPPRGRRRRWPRRDAIIAFAAEASSEGFERQRDEACIAASCSSLLQEAINLIEEFEPWLFKQDEMRCVLDKHALFRRCVGQVPHEQLAVFRI